MSPVKGACLCGAVQFSIELPTEFCVHCHCSICQRVHGAAYVTWVGVTRERFALSSSSDRLRTFQSSEHGRRSFCATCGSSLFCESDRHPDQIDIVLASLKGAIDRAPTVHIYFDSHADWAALDDKLPRLSSDEGDPGA